MACQWNKVHMQNSNSEFPVFCWTYYPFADRLGDEKVISDWKDLGFNAPLTPRVDAATDKKEFRSFLDKCLEAGLHPYVYDTRIADRDVIFKIIGADNKGAESYRKLVREVVADWGDHPAVRGFYVCDEPLKDDSSAAFLAARIQREEAPHLQPFLNLNPWFDSMVELLGAKNLAEYLDRAHRESGLDFMGYDCYAQQIEGYHDNDIGDYFRNLREWAEFGQRTGVRWNTTLLCVPHFRYVIKSADDFRWQISTAAAMGAKGISWFYPDHHLGPHVNYRDPPINAFGERTPTFTWLSTEMRYFQHQFGAEMMRLTWEKAYCVGKTFGGLPQFVPGIDCEGSDRNLLEARGESLLVSFFHDDDGMRYAAIVNLSHESSKDSNFTFAGGIKAESREWNKWDRFWEPWAPNKVKDIWRPLAPGQMILIRFVRE